MEAKSIRYLKIVIEPGYYHRPNTPFNEHIFRFTVEVNGVKHNFQRVVLQDDLESIFDLTFEYAKAELERLIKEQRESSLISPEIYKK